MTIAEKRLKNGISQATRRSKLKKYISDIGCLSCKEHHPGLLEVHHLSKEAKRYKRSQDLMYNVQDIKAGTAVVLCANCHSLFHYHFGGKISPFPDQTVESVLKVVNLERSLER
jgi:hypothetical protein